jgi:hemolysin type calcium-binding protein
VLNGGDGHDFNRNWGNDLLTGFFGEDVMVGAGGNDTFVSDRYNDDGSRDLLFGFGGNDRLAANDGVANDYVSAGAGTDECRIDAYEQVYGCEHAHIGG